MAGAHELCSAKSFFTMVEEAKDVLELPVHTCEALQHADSQFNVVVLLSKTFEKARLEPPKMRSLAWTLFILARGMTFA